MAPTTPETAANGHAKSEFLKLFWTLAESDVATRTRAAAQLLAYLRENADDVQYTLKRLVRGLASSRDAARQGFSAALATVLGDFTEAVSLGETLELLNEAMEVSASMKAMEQREHMFGKLFGLLALHRSGRLADDEEATVAVVKALAAMSKWKKWFREACMEAILTVLSDVSPQLFTSQLAAELAVLLEGESTAFSADQVALAVGLQHYTECHKINASDLPSNFAAVNFVRRKHIHALIEPLKHSTACFPRVHGAWFGLFGHIMHVGSESSKLDSELFQEAWSVLVENMLLNASTTTHERKGLALKLFELVLPALPSAVLRSILSPNLVKCFFNNTQSKKTYLHDAARHTLKAFATCSPAEFFHFFQREFVKPMHALVEGAVGDANDEDLSAVVQGGGFDAIIAIEEERERQASLLRKHATVRLWALEHIVNELIDLINNDVVNLELRDQVVRFLTFHAFFEPLTKSTPSKKSKKNKHKTAGVAFESSDPVLSAEVRSAVVKKLFSVVSAKLSSESDGTLSSVFETAFELLGEHELRSPLDESQRALLTTARSHISVLHDEIKTGKEATDNAFLVLFMSSGLQLLDPSQREHAQGIVSDLEKCFIDIQRQKNAVSKSKKSPNKKSPKKKHEAEGEEPLVDAVVVLTDLLLSQLSQDSSAMREIVTHVFRDLIPLLNEPSLKTLVAAVAPMTSEDDDDEVKPEEDGDDEDVDAGDGDEEEEVVLSSAQDIAEALRTDANLAELHREDQTLSAIVGHVKDRAKAKKDAKKHRLQVLHFKLRVVDLLSVYATSAHKTSSSSQVVKLMFPLFESLAAIANSDVEQRVLKERLQGVLLHKFVRGAKDTATSLESSTERAEAVAALEKVAELLSKKVLDKELASKVGTAVFIHMIRSIAGGNEIFDVKTIKSLHEIVRSAALDVFTKKHSKFPRAVFDELILRLPKLSVRVLLPALTEIASANGNHVAADDFSRAEVFRLLSSLTKSKLLNEPSERQVFDTNRRTLLASLISQLEQKKETDEDSKKTETKTKRLKVFLSFALHFVRTWRELHCEEGLSELVDVVQSIPTNSPVIKSMIKQLEKAVGADDADDVKKGSLSGLTAQQTATPKSKKVTPLKRKRASPMVDNE